LIKEPNKKLKLLPKFIKSSLKEAKEVWIVGQKDLKRILQVHHRLLDHHHLPLVVLLQVAHLLLQTQKIEARKNKKHTIKNNTNRIQPIAQNIDINLDF